MAWSCVIIAWNEHYQCPLTASYRIVTFWIYGCDMRRPLVLNYYPYSLPFIFQHKHLQIPIYMLLQQLLNARVTQTTVEV